MHTAPIPAISGLRYRWLARRTSRSEARKTSTPIAPTATTSHHPTSRVTVSVKAWSDARVIDSASPTGTSTRPIVSAAHPARASPAPPANPLAQRRPKQARSAPTTITAAPITPPGPRFDATSSSVAMPDVMPAVGRLVRMSMTSPTAAIRAVTAPMNEAMKMNRTRNRSRSGGSALTSSSPSNSSGAAAGISNVVIGAPVGGANISVVTSPSVGPDLSATGTAAGSGWVGAERTGSAGTDPSGSVGSVTPRSAVPHVLQNRCRTLTALPHDGHTMTSTVTTRLRAPTA